MACRVSCVEACRASGDENPAANNKNVPRKAVVRIGRSMPADCVIACVVVVMAISPPVTPDGMLLQWRPAGLRARGVTRPFAFPGNVAQW